jgi:hypothetical protein
LQFGFERLVFLVARIVLGMKLLLYRDVLAIFALNWKVDLVDLLCLFNNLIVVGLLLSAIFL